MTARPAATCKPDRPLMRFRADQAGVAAVEFAFILPLLLVLYFGAAAISRAVSAMRGVTVLARTLSDLTSQQAPNVKISDALMRDIFNASPAVMAPFPTASLKMTVSNIEFVPNSASASNALDAKVRWTVTFSGGTLRPCVTSASGSGATTVLTPVSDTSTPSPTTMPLGLYTAGFLIVADVSYVYTPAVGLFTWDAAGTSPVSFPMARTTYMRPRQTDNVRYASGQTAQICNITSPQVQ